ncbi:MAG: hypothetical protein QHI48_01145 [Bacteroidota bacterium]|nr:hypothetical protein [Bacteroidota bacterium]
MGKTKPPKNVSLIGEIVELRDRKGKRTAKILLKAVCIDVADHSLDDVRLGDTVLIETRISIPTFERVRMDPPEP